MQLLILFFKSCIYNLNSSIIKNTNGTDVFCDIETLLLRAITLRPKDVITWLQTEVFLQRLNLNVCIF